MTYELTIEQQDGYLHATVTGRNSGENVRGYLQQVIRECADRDCRYLLIEERLDGPRLRTMDVFVIVSVGSNRFLGMLNAIAYVDVNAEGDLMEFAETVAVNRAFPLKVLPIVEAARIWLRDEMIKARVLPPSADAEAPSGSAPGDG